MKLSIIHCIQLDIWPGLINKGIIYITILASQIRQGNLTNSYLVLSTVIGIIEKAAMALADAPISKAFKTIKFMIKIL